MNNLPLPNKNVAVVLLFDQGTLESGLSVATRILENGTRVEQRDRLRIPAVPELKARYQDWKQHYINQGRSVARSKRALDLPPAVVAYSSVDACRNAATNLLSYLNQQWFNSVEFQALKDWIRSRALVQTDQSVPIFFEFDTGSREQDILLRQLPWPRWDLFRELPNAEPTLGIAFGKPVESSLKNIKILAVFGSDEGGLDLEADRCFVDDLTKIGAQIKPLHCPEPSDLYAELKQNPYDVLFFAGHSLSEEDQQDGAILLKPKTFVSIDALSPSLQAAVSKGLKLAIFNSCDGLGLADPLVKREKIPSVVVFREPVPDEVARIFLKCFLQEFSNGKPLFLSVREARNQLRWLEDRPENPLPGASWLPVVCQNPSQPEMTLERADKSSASKNWILKAGVAVLALVALGFGVKAIRERMVPPVVPPQLEALISRGDKLVITSETNDAKRRGIEAYADGDWNEAIAAFRESLNEELDEEGSLDPETWIYLNNAIAEKNDELNLGQMVELAIAIPANANNDDGQPGGEQDVSKELLRGGALRQAEFNCGVETLVSAVTNLDAELNCQGTQGKFVHVTVADDRDDSSTAIAVASALSNASVMGVVGHFSSDSCRSAGKIYGDNEVVTISPTCTSTELRDFNDFFFRTVPSDDIAAERLWSNVAVGSRVAAVAYVENVSEYSESFKEASEERLLNQRYIHTCGSLIDNFSVAQCATDAEQQDANFLLLVPTTTDVLNIALPILRELDEGITPLGSDSVYNPVVIANYGQQAAETGLRIYVSWHPDPSNRTSFEENATRLFTVEGWNWRTQSSYDALSALTQGVLDSGNNLSREVLKNRLHSSNFSADGVFGENTVKFLPSGDRDLSGLEDEVGVIVRVEEYQDAEGNTKYRFVRVDE